MKKAKKNKSDGFVEYRKGQILHYLRLLENSANSRRYAYNESEIDAIFVPIESAVARAKFAFLGFLKPPINSENTGVASGADMIVQQIAIDMNPSPLPPDHSSESVFPVRRIVRLWECPLCGSQQDSENASCETCGAKFVKRRFEKLRLR